MPRLTTESFGSGDQSWLGSAHGISNARTEPVDVSTFTVVDGYIPSGTPVAKVGGVLVPYDGTEATVTGAGILAGFILFDQPTDGVADFPAALLDHGRVKAANVPGTFVAPVAAAKKSATTIVFV